MGVSLASGSLRESVDLSGIEFPAGHESLAVQELGQKGDEEKIQLLGFVSVHTVKENGKAGRKNKHRTQKL